MQVNSRKYLSTKAGKPNYKAQHITTFQNASQIITQLKRAEKESRPTAQQLAKYFCEADKYKTAQKVWYFLRNEIFYEAEPKNDQTAKTVKRFLADATGDCKHFATFAVSVLNACGIPCWFTFVGQFKDQMKPNHAYATCLINGKRVVIDACRKYFNSPPDYYYKWEIKRDN
ncbi:MAG: transglutaminase-like domain-containing protein [Magnetococcus sp. YQC-3]